MKSNKFKEANINCSALFALDVLSKKWIVPIICSLSHHEVMRFGELSRAVGNITSAMLTNCLKELHGYGIVSRTQYNEMPLRVEYSLTSIGKEIVPSLMSLSKWGLEIMDDTSQICDCPNGDCMVKVHNVVHFRREEMRSLRDEWDSYYKKSYDEIQTDYPQLDPIKKLILLSEKFMEKNTSRGEEFSRLATIYYILGERKSDDLISQNRLAVKIISKILQEGREKDVITDYMTDEEIVHATFAYIQGLNSYWELERGIYHIVEKNKKGLELFFESFRKR